VFGRVWLGENRCRGSQNGRTAILHSRRLPEGRGPWMARVNPAPPLASNRKLDVDLYLPIPPHPCQRHDQSNRITGNCPANPQLLPGPLGPAMPECAIALPVLGLCASAPRIQKWRLCVG